MAYPITVTTPLGDSLKFRAMAGKEELGRLFEYQVDMVSDDASLAFTDMVGQTMTVKVLMADESFRYFDGVIARFRLVGGKGRLSLYRGHDAARALEAHLQEQLQDLPNHDRGRHHQAGARATTASPSRTASPLPTPPATTACQYPRGPTSTSSAV